MNPVKLSIILPTFQETNTGYLKKIFLSLIGLSDIELIIVNKKSQDGTLEQLNDLCKTIKPIEFKIIFSDSIARGKRLKEGFENSTGNIILFHHPRSIIERNGIEFLINNYESLNWGGFTHKFDETNLFFRFTSFYSNKIRADLNNIFYLDHCIYAKRTLLEKIKIPEQEIFEDTSLSILLSEKAKPKRLEFISTTSTIRFRKNGILFQIILNQIMKIGYYLKIPFPLLNRIYEKSLELNSPIIKKPK